MPLLAAWVYTAFLGLFITLFVLVSVLLIMIILIQKGRGGGLASAFGGGGGNTAFGSKTGDVLTWATSIVFRIFLILAVVTNVTANHIHDKYKKDVIIQQEKDKQSAPAEGTAPANNPLTPDL